VKIPVVFRPTQSGPRSGALVIRAKGLLGTNQLSITGKGQGLSIQLSPDVLDFGALAVGADPVSRQLVIVNVGEMVVDLTAAVDPGPGPATGAPAGPLVLLVAAVLLVLPRRHRPLHRRVQARHDHR